jgi:hypothetical protein
MSRAMGGGRGFDFNFLLLALVFLGTFLMNEADAKE